MIRYLVVLLILSKAIPAQSFEVASIKPYNPKDSCPNANLLPGGRFVAACWPLRTILQEAYDLLPSQISGGPAWLYTDQWDISAKADGFAGEIPRVQFQLMLRRLIEERFHLILLEDTKVLPGLALVVAGKKGSKLMPNAGASFQFDVEAGPTLICKKVTMAKLASWLKGFTGAGRVVVDKTGLAGEYDFVLRWTPQPLGQSPEDRSPSDGNVPSIFTALQEQLGLRVESQELPTTILVVESADRPTDN